MTPDGLKEWAHAIRVATQELLPDRDSKAWTALSGAGGMVATMAYANPDMFPPGWAARIVFWIGAATTLSTKMGWSWAGAPVKTNERRAIEQAEATGAAAVLVCTECGGKLPCANHPTNPGKRLSTDGGAQ